MNTTSGGYETFCPLFYRVHYESNEHDFIVTRLSIAARSDRSDNVVGVCASKRTRSQFASSQAPQAPMYFAVTNTLSLPSYKLPIVVCNLEVS